MSLKYSWNNVRLFMDVLEFFRKNARRLESSLRLVVTASHHRMFTTNTVIEPIFQMEILLTPWLAVGCIHTRSFVWGLFVAFVAHCKAGGVDGSPVVIWQRELIILQF